MPKGCERLRRWPLLAVLAIALLGGKSVAAAPIAYKTQGFIYSWAYGNGAIPGITGTNAIVFDGVDLGTLEPGKAFTLGRFVVSAPQAGSATTYNHAAFAITLDATPATGPRVLAPGELPFSSISLYGALDGTIGGPNDSTVVATVLSIRPNPPVQITAGTPLQPVFTPPFPLSALTVDTPLALAPAAVNGGQTVLVGEVRALPEPSALAVLIAAAAGWAVFGRRRLAG